MNIFILACLLSTTLADYDPTLSARAPADGGRTGRRNASDVTTVTNLIKDTLEKASKGIEIGKLEIAAGKVRRAAIFYLRKTGTGVPLQEVQTLIDELADSFNITVVTTLNGRRVNISTENLASALALWSGLADRAVQLQASGQSARPAVVGIRWVSRIIRHLAKNTEDSVTYFRENAEEDSELARNLVTRAKPKPKKSKTKGPVIIIIIK